jgi:hypothetical protein
MGTQAPDIRILHAAEARRALTDGDIRSEVAFQNDINTMIARLDEVQPFWRALTSPEPGARAPGGRPTRR